MRLIEGVGGEFLPVGPYLLKHLRVVTVLHAAFDELRLHGIYDVLLLLTHRLTQRVALASGEVCQLTAEQHDLLLIYRDAVGVLQVLLHARYVVGDRLLSVLALDERGDVVHRSRTVEGVHGDEVFKYRRVQLAKVFLHSRTLKLECSDGLSALIELICQFIVNGDIVQVDVYAACQLYILHGLLLLRERLQAQEVHLYQSC